MPQSTRDWTAAEVLALPSDGNRYEVVDGELLVRPAPELPHQHAVWPWSELWIRLFAPTA